jgi:hypothetical protein
MNGVNRLIWVHRLMKCRPVPCLTILLTNLKEPLLRPGDDYCAKLWLMLVLRGTLGNGGTFAMVTKCGLG